MYQRCKGREPRVEELSARGSARRRFLVDAGALTTGAATAPYLHGAETDAGTETRRVSEWSRVQVQFIVNGQTHAIELDPRVTLLDALRERLQLTGTKQGCDR